MILALAMENGLISSHYAHSDRFDLYEIHDNQAIFKESIDYAPKTHLESFDQFVIKKVNAIAVDMIGDETFEHLIGRNIDVYYGQKGNFQIFLDDFLHGLIPLPKPNLLDDEQSCSL
jgi:predicted Fe-Mo cluster-binding NifX family protein